MKSSCYFKWYHHLHRKKKTEPFWRNFSHKCAPLTKGLNAIDKQRPSFIVTVADEVEGREKKRKKNSDEIKQKKQTNVIASKNSQQSGSSKYLINYPFAADCDFYWLIHPAWGERDRFLSDWPNAKDPNHRRGKDPWRRSSTLAFRYHRRSSAAW